MKTMRNMLGGEDILPNGVMTKAFDVCYRDAYDSLKKADQLELQGTIALYESDAPLTRTRAYDFAEYVAALNILDERNGGNGK